MGWFDFVYKVSLITTLFVLIKYTQETRKIRLITAEQKDLQLLPAMMLYIRRKGGTERPVIRNIGFGTAVDVRVLPSTFYAGSEKLRFTFRLIDNNTTLIPDDERLIGIKLKVNNEEDDTYPLETFVVYHDPSAISNAQQRGEKRDDRKVTIHFRDITGQEYETVIAFKADGISVAHAPRRLFRKNDKD